MKFFNFWKKKNKKKPLINKNGRPKIKLNLDEIKRLKLDGKSDKEIAEIFKVSYKTINRRLKGS